MTRSSNYELLRIISMGAIVIHHFSCHSGWKIPEEDKATFRRASLDIIGCLGKVGVDLFMILTGYFLYGRPAKVASVICVWIQVLEYSVSFYFIFSFHKNMNTSDFLKSFFPLSTGSYWFVSAYMVVVLLSPALGKMTSNLTHNEFIGTLFVMFYSMSLMHYSYHYAYSHAFWFTMLFIIGGYFKKYEEYYAKVKAKTYFILFASNLVLNIALIIYFTIHRNKWVDHHGGPHFLTNESFGPLALSTAILLFLFVSKLELSSQKINKLASTTFGVYLIHDNIFLRGVIWKQWVCGAKHYGKPEFYIFIIIAPIIVYLGCSIIEILRQKVLSRLDKWISERIAHIISKIFNRETIYCANRGHHQLELVRFESQDLHSDLSSSIKSFDLDLEDLEEER